MTNANGASRLIVAQSGSSMKKLVLRTFLTASAAVKL